MNFGAFVEVLPGKEGLVHISQLATHRVENVTDEVDAEPFNEFVCSDLP